MNKKLIFIIITLIVTLLIIAGVIWAVGFMTKGTKNDTVLEGDTSRVNKLCLELKEKQAFSFRTKLDEENDFYYAKNDNMAYIDRIYLGDESKFIIRDGNSYLILDDSKIYYTYRNNETDLEKVLVQLETTIEEDYTEGKEKIDNKEYRYEEYEGVSEFLLKNVPINENQIAKTRFYFNGDNLVYIKTVIGDYEELLKVDISYDVDKTLFEIPSEYQAR